MGIMGIFLCAGEVFATNGENSAFSNAVNTLEVTFDNSRNVVYYISGFGLIGVAVAAIMGKINWKWLAMICVALATLAGTEKIRDYATNRGVPVDESYAEIGDNNFDLDLQFDE